MQNFASFAKNPKFSRDNFSISPETLGGALPPPFVYAHVDFGKKREQKLGLCKNCYLSFSQVYMVLNMFNEFVLLLKNLVTNVTNVIFLQMLFHGICSLASKYENFVEQTYFN